MRRDVKRFLPPASAGEESPENRQRLIAAPPYQAYGSGYSWSGFCRQDKRSAIRRAVPDGGSALSGLQGSAPGFVGQISTAPSGGQCLMAASPYQAYGSGYSWSGFCRPDKRSAIRRAVPGGGSALSGLQKWLQLLGVL
ncbi:hypothetical protein CYD30_05905 [Kosakonia cowanii]|nr:hypothetical protein CYD30_05905 [Kosakonia cowanii]